jgi:hypothetical protein
MTPNDNRKTQQAGHAEDKALEKLEEMWDRQILKGDDEFFESRRPSRPEKAKADLNEDDKPVKQRRRRGRKF